MDALPPLTGTPKQVKWAATLRTRHVAMMRRWGRGASGDDRQLRAFASILANAEAVWWIDRPGFAQCPFTPLKSDRGIFSGLALHQCIFASARRAA